MAKWIKDAVFYEIYPQTFCDTNGDVTAYVSDYLKKYYGSKDYGHIAFITCNHDSPRMSKFHDEDTLKLANAVILTQPGVPFIYYGDEIGIKFQEGLTSVYI